MAIFSKKKNEEKTISTHQISVLPTSKQNVFLDNRKTINVLRAINAAPTKFDAIDVIINQTADGRMAYNTFLRLANQGITVELYSATTGRLVKKYDNELRDFTKNIGKNNACGLDGLIDQLHGSAIARTGMAVEVVVNSDATDVDEVIIIDPATITEFKWIPEKKRYAAYQNGINSKKVDLYDGNFLWVPHQPKPGSPLGTFQFEPAIATMTQFYQLLQDSMVVLNRIGYPRYKCEIDRAALLESATPAQKATPEAQAKMFNQAFSMVEEQMRKMGKDNDLVTFDSNKVDVLGGGLNGSGIDIRAWFEVLEPLIPNSFSLTPVLMGRLTSGSYSLGTAEYKIVRDTVDTMRRSSKRVIEEIIDLWARVRGFNVRAKVTHNPIDWQTELEKLDVQLKKIEKARRAEEYRWITHDEAAQQALGQDKASEPAQLDMFEYLSKSETDESSDSNALNEQMPDDVKNSIVNKALQEMGFEVT